MDFIRGQNTPYFSWNLISKYDFGPVKLPGLSRNGPQNSKVASHVHQFSHNMNFANVKVIGVESKYQERLFLEAWHSTVDPNAGNDHIVLPEAYKGITRAWITWSRAQASRYVWIAPYDNELHFHITDEGLSIRRNVWLETKSQWQTISIEPIKYTSTLACIFVL